MKVQCRDFRELADSYLSDELLVETNHDVLRHLEACADCRRELAARRELRAKLRKGFQEAPQLQMREGFAGESASSLRDVALSRPPLFPMSPTRYVAAAAVLLLVIALGFSVVQIIWRGANQPTSSNPLLASLNQDAAGVHRDCALNHSPDEKPVSLAEAGRNHDRAFTNLVNAVMTEASLPAGVELVEGHSCVVKGQRFGHVILKYHGQVVSVLVTGLQQSNVRPEEVIASAQAEGFQLAHFETAGHAVFVVSGLKDSENMLLARAIAPSVSRQIKRAALQSRVLKRG